MLNSREIGALRPDVAANCQVFLERCRAEGLPVLVTGTVRDDAFQLQCYKNGTSKAKKPAFHGVKYGLAFDICKNVKGHEYDDLGFFARCGAIGEAMGFEWGGRWSSFPDRPHFQWSGPQHNYKSRDLWAGRVPGDMPRCAPTVPEAPKPPTVPEAPRELPVSAWAKASWEKATRAGVFDGTRPQGALTREQAAVMLDRLGLIK